MTERSLERFADRLVATYADDGEVEVWLDRVEDLKALSDVFAKRGIQSEVNVGKQTLTVRFKV